MPQASENPSSASPSGSSTSPNMQTSRKQPWKSHWPPKDGIKKEVAYGFKEFASIVIYGN